MSKQRLGKIKFGHDKAFNSTLMQASDQNLKAPSTFAVPSRHEMKTEAKSHHYKLGSIKTRDYKQEDRDLYAQQIAVIHQERPEFLKNAKSMSQRMRIPNFKLETENKFKRVSLPNNDMQSGIQTVPRTDRKSVAFKPQEYEYAS